MQQDQQMMIFMLLVVMALMMSRDTHKLFADTTRTWAQFGSSNYKAISALTAAVIVATIGKSVLDVFDGERKGMYNNSQRIAREQRATTANIFEAGQRNLANLAARQTMEVRQRYPRVLSRPEMTNDEKMRVRNDMIAKMTEYDKHETDPFLPLSVTKTRLDPRFTPEFSEEKELTDKERAFAQALHAQEERRRQIKFETEQEQQELLKTLAQMRSTA